MTVGADVNIAVRTCSSPPRSLPSRLQQLKAQLLTFYDTLISETGFETAPAKN
jgi:hypothetical protein